MAKRKKAKNKGSCTRRTTVKFKGKETGTGRKTEIKFQARTGENCKPAPKSAEWKANTGKGGRLAKATEVCKRELKLGKHDKKGFFPAKAGTQTTFNKCIHSTFAQNGWLAK